MQCLLVKQDPVKNTGFLTRKVDQVHSEQVYTGCDYEFQGVLATYLTWVLLLDLDKVSPELSSA